MIPLDRVGCLRPADANEVVSHSSAADDVVEVSDVLRADRTAEASTLDEAQLPGVVLTVDCQSLHERGGDLAAGVAYGAT